MLIRKMKKGEVIYIGKEISIFIRDIKGKLVVIGFEAPKDVLIVRNLEFKEDNENE